MQKFEDLLKTSELYLRRVDKFIDQFEAKLDGTTSDKISYLFHEFPNWEQMQNQLRNILTSFRTACFVNCWHLNNSESIQMWKEYCGDTEGVAIKTSVDNLINSILPHDFGPMHFRPVAYGTRDLTGIDLRFPLELLNFKDQQYEHEKEYRVSLIYINSPKLFEELQEFEEVIINPPEESIRLKVNLSELVQELIISPFATTECKQKIHELCKIYLKSTPTQSIF
ncbi:MAG: DUF2971 domain-containing protein [Sphingobacteriales bacterium]|nr:MAG: DUF2971 domain-containing protein [Sphingobacteriales bacterium]